MEVEEVLDIIAMTFDLKFTKKETTYFVDGDGCFK
jgi:hypothetical protein